MEIASIVTAESAPFSRNAGGPTAPPAGVCPWPASAEPAPKTLTAKNVAGSWYVLALAGGKPAYQGVLRVSVEGGKLAVSSDIYRTGGGTRAADYPRKSEMLKTASGWHPQPHRRDYAFHLRAMGGALSDTTLALKARAFSWKREADTRTSNRVGDFDGFSDAVITLSLSSSTHSIRRNGPARPVLSGSAKLAGRHLDIWAVKAADVTRGLRLVIHEMDGHPWPEDPKYNGDMLGAIYRDAGVELDIVRAGAKIPADDSLIRSELDAMLNEQVARYDAGPVWIQHVFLVSSLNWSGLDMAGQFGNIAGLMFDNVGRQRQGCAVFLEAKVSSSVEALNDRIDETIRDKPIGKTPEALLRTMAHEVGHGLGLRHTAKKRAADRGIMNQIQGLLRQVDPETGPLFPEIAKFTFDAFDTRNLTHRPDPEVCPGWGNWSVPPKGLELGLQPDPGCPHDFERDPVLDLHLSAKPANELAATAARPVIKRVFDLGEPVFLELTVRNITDEPITVPASVTLTDGMSEVAILDPGAERRRLIGAAQTLCEGTGTATLAPSEEHRHTLQLHSSGDEPIFTRDGAHRVEMAIWTEEHGWVEAPPVVVVIQPEMPSVRSAFRVTGRYPFCDAMALGYIQTYRGVSDTDRLLRHSAYPLGSRIAAGVLQVATFAEQPKSLDGSDRVSPMRVNPRRVDQAIAFLKETGVTKEVVVAVALAIDPLTARSSAVAEAIAAGWDKAV